MSVPAVVARGVRKVYLFNVALDNVDYEVDGGGIHIIMGPNGSGKSTLLSIIAGAERPSSGYVKVLGLDPWRDSEKLAGKVKALLDRASLPPWASCREVAEITARTSRTPWSDVLETAEALGVTSFWGRPYGTYSTGMKRKALLLTALIGDPEILLLDEPYQGLDSGSVETLTKIIIERATKGQTIIIATHITPEKLVENARTIAKMELGRIVELRKQPIT
ncbi:MAG: ABC transporter ATP-binding protein [Thermoprotei archaeon]|nr:ABC transporter ATP-binding protein [Thermoprotei archaeon]